MVFVLLSYLAAQAVAGPAPRLDLHLVPSGTFHRVGGYRPYGESLSKTAPAGVSGLPSNVEYASLKFGSSSKLRSYLIGIEEPVTESSLIYVDTHGDGSLKSTPPIRWTSHSNKNHLGEQQVSYDASVTIDLPYRGAVVPCVVQMYPIQPDKIGYYGDFSLQGTINLNGVSYDAIYWDSKASWNPQDDNGTLMIDTDHDGKFHPGYEFFKPNEPFNIKGTTYELRANGDELGLVKSSKVVKERSLADIPADPNLSNGLRPGKVAPVFSETTLSGQHVSFPKSYAGKVVMLDFWATWCGPCMREAPNVVAVYAKYHSQGFEILGVSLDNPNSQAQIEKVTSKVSMTWPQIYQGKAWESGLVKQFGIKAIPATYLVDGDSGKIIAMLDQLRGPKLEETVKKALAGKQK